MNESGSVKEEKFEFGLKDFGQWLLLAIGLCILISWVYVSVMAWWFNDLEQQAQFGDQFGAVNAIISGIALMMVVLASMFQMRDLGQQTKSLNLQIQEFKDQKQEMARAAEAQENANDLQRKMMKVEALKMEFEYYIGLASGLRMERTLNGVSYEKHLERVQKELKILIDSQPAVYKEEKVESSRKDVS